jgi:hypothetical protein
MAKKLISKSGHTSLFGCDFRKESYTEKVGLKMTVIMGRLRVKWSGSFSLLVTS